MKHGISREQKRAMNMQYGRFANLPKVAQGMVYFVDGLNGEGKHRGRILPWHSPWTPDFSDGSFWRPSDCFLMIPPANWECD